jgi:hypothetical protein
MRMSEKVMAICDEDIKALIEKEAIKEVAGPEQRFVSGFFVIPKSSCGYRLIINLERLNRLVEPKHFKMEGIGVLKELVSEGDHFCKIDLKDAYLTIPLYPDDKEFLQFRWRGKGYQFLSLCFGLASAPWAFTKILKPVVAFLRRQGIRIIIYLDDILILNQSKKRVEKDFATTVRILEACGFLINTEKSIGEGAKYIEYLGLLINSEKLSLSLLPKKKGEIVLLCEKALNAESISLRDIAKILGNFAWAEQARHLLKLTFE